MHSRIQALLKCIDLEEKEQAARFSLNEQHSLKMLKAEGLALHPIIVTRKSFGYAEYPEISFKLSFPPGANMFRDGMAIECFVAGEEPVKGMLLQLDGKQGEFRLYAPDFPDWIEDNGVGIKLAPDTRTTTIMKKTLADLEQNKKLFTLFTALHDGTTFPVTTQQSLNNIQHSPSAALNASQQAAVSGIIDNQSLVVVHGPPGTGKTTTLVEAICRLIGHGERVVVSAPSNTAVDHISKSLLQRGVRLLRVGNTSKVDEQLFAHTPEGKLQNSKLQKEIKQLRVRAEEFRKMALKYKRSFGKAEREQRQLLFKEVKSIRQEIKKIQVYNEEKLFEEAQVIAGTPIGLYDSDISKLSFNTLVIDEAGQCIEPLAWCILPLAERYVLAGDHFQLPPTVLSDEASKLGMNKSILEVAIPYAPAVYLLDTQYRMRPSIAAFSSQYFYNSLLQAAAHLQDTGTHITFIDTAGSGSEEQRGPDGNSLQNEAELTLASQLIESASIDPTRAAFISPYSGQVTVAKERLPQSIRVSTIDSFQGQEKEIIIISLVRSNDDGDIGFLKDYRRMNVALTRAKDELYVIGDSATLGGDAFYRSFLEYVEAHGAYRTIWEFS